MNEQAAKMTAYSVPRNVKNGSCWVIDYICSCSVLLEESVYIFLIADLKNKKFGNFPIYLSELILSGKICSIIVATLTAHHTPILGSYNDTLCILGLYTNHFKYFEYLHDCLSNLIHKISCTGPVSLLYDVS